MPIVCHVATGEVISGLPFGTVTILVLDTQVLSRLVRLGKSVSNIGMSGNLSKRVSIRKEMLPLLTAKNQSLEVDIEERLPLIRADKKRVRQVLLIPLC